MDSSSPRVTADLAARLLRPSRTPRVLVVGDGMVDHYVSGDVDRISPEAPVPVVRVDGESRAPGGAANVAAGVTALGADCRLACVRGDDAAGRRLEGLLEETGVGVGDVLASPDRPTTVKTRVLARHQQMLRIDREATVPLDAGLRGRLLEAVEDGLAWADAVAVVDYDKGVLGEGLGARVVERAREAGVPSVVDPKLRSFFDYRGAFLFKPNGRELAAARGDEEPRLGDRELRQVREELACRHMLVTLGGEGMILVGDGDGPARRIPSEAREVYDVTGAGDTVTAVLAAALGGSGGEVAEAAALANFAAGLAVSRLGAVPVGRDEILAALDGRGGGGSGTRSPGDAPRETETEPS